MNFGKWHTFPVTLTIRPMGHFIDGIIMFLPAYGHVYIFGP
jgi:hypothetical protein